MLCQRARYLSCYSCLPISSQSTVAAAGTCTVSFRTVLFVVSRFVRSDVCLTVDACGMFTCEFANVNPDLADDTTWGVTTPVIQCCTAVTT